MKILIVSGFLGAGKTTFIKELIKHTGTRPVVLENEYGDNSIDARELKSVKSGEKKLEILEFMEGCVCCTMKDSFINSVLTVFSGLSPEYLIVEPTGVGRLSSIIENLKPILHGNITLLKPVVVLSPNSFPQNMAEFGPLYKDQVANAQTVIFSKCENESPEVLSEVTDAIRELNKEAEIINTHYTNQSDAWWNSVLEIEADEQDVVNDISGEELVLSQLTLREARISNPGQLVVLLEDCLRGRFGLVARAKGTVLLTAVADALRFDLADGLYSITGSDITVNECVFIGKNLDEEALCRALGTDEKETGSPVQMRARR